MFQRRTTGSVVCPACGSLVGVRDDKCYSCGRSNPGLWGFAPALRSFGADLGFVPLVITASCALYVIALVASGAGAVGFGGIFDILSPSWHVLQVLGASGAGPVFDGGRWWSVLSATWLHASLLHILFNMMWVRDLGPAMADLIGPSRTVIVYIVGGVSGFLLSSVMGLDFIPSLPMLSGAGVTVGASASVFGLMGALLHYGHKSGSGLIRAQAKQFALMGIVFGFLMPGIDNFAHLGGLAGGYLTSMFFNPLTRERGDHMLVAVLCLAASFLAVAFSVYYYWSLVGAL